MSQDESLQKINLKTFLETVFWDSSCPWAGFFLIIFIFCVCVQVRDNADCRELLKVLLIFIRLVHMSSLGASVEVFNHIVPFMLQ